MKEALRWLCMMPLASADNLAQVTRLSRATVNRQLAMLHNDGLAVSRMVGRRRPATRRWTLSLAELMQVYTFDHGREAHGPHDHLHDPLFPDMEDHQHVPWWLGEAGVRELYQRLEQLEAVYEVAPSLFQGEGRNWLASGSEARLVRVQFLRRGQLVEMIATYDGGIEIAFCWVGTQLRPRLMMEKWRDRFSHPYLEYISEAREQERERERERDHLVEQPDPAFDPTPQLAGYVVIGPDEWGVRQAMDLLPRQGYLRQNVFSWWVAGREVRQVGRRGLVVPNEDRVVDRYEEIHVGEPERVALPARQGRRDDPPAPAALSGVLANRLMGLSEEFDALEEEDYVDLADEFRGPVRQTLADLVSGGMLAKVEEVYYLADPAMVYAAGRDRTSVSTVRRRGSSFLNPDMQRHRHYLDHNAGVIRIVRALKRHGIPVYGGWRGVTHIQRVTQVQPDGVMYADGPYGRGVYRVEYEREATTPEDVLDKLVPYRRAAGAGVPLRAVWVCETERGAGRFLGLSRGLQAMVTTLHELEAGPLAGPKTVWRSADGRDLQLRPY